MIGNTAASGRIFLKGVKVNKLFILAVVFCGCLLFSSCTNPDGVSDDPGEDNLSVSDGQGGGTDLLNFLIERNEAGREKIKSYSFTLEADQKYQKNLATGAAEVKGIGDYLWCKHLQTQLNSAGGLMLERETRVVVNDTFSAIWRGPMVRTADQYLHRSFETMDPKRKSTIRTTMPHQFMGYCFGDPVTSFRESLALYPEKVKWRAIKTEKADGKQVYEIWRSSVTGGESGVKVKWVLDPAKGYLATECTAYQDNAIWLRRVMEVEELAKGVWFPIEFREERRDRQGGSDGSKVISEETIWLKNVVVNEGIPDEQFEFDALNLQKDMPDVIVLRFGLDGSRVPYVYYGGRLVPQKAVLRGKHTGDVEAEIEKFENEQNADNEASR